MKQELLSGVRRVVLLQKVVICMVLLALPIVASAALVLDGSFEDTVAHSPFQTFNAGQTFGGWTVTSGSIDLINGYWAAADGNQSVDLAGNNHGTIQQTVNASAGLYQLSFALSGNSDGPPTIKTVLVTVGNQTKLFSFTTPAQNNGNMLWTKESWDVYIPTGGSTTLSFADVSGGNNPTPYGAALDNVSLVCCVPEAGTFVAGAMLLLPFGAGSLRILRRLRTV